jgi:hypothetical protein
VSDLSRQQITSPISGKVLHEIIRASFEESVTELTRVDITRPEEFLQLAVIQIPANHTFKAHIHLERERSFSNLKAQESWVVVRGQVEVDYYSEFGDFMCTETLGAGDISITFHGGHGYRTTTSDALVYEYKSGPYEGQEIDKRFI